MDNYGIVVYIIRAGIAGTGMAANVKDIARNRAGVNNIIITVSGPAAAAVIITVQPKIDAAGTGGISHNIIVSVNCGAAFRTEHEHQIAVVAVNGSNGIFHQVVVNIIHTGQNSGNQVTKIIILDGAGAIGINSVVSVPAAVGIVHHVMVYHGVGSALGKETHIVAGAGMSNAMAISLGNTDVGGTSNIETVLVIAETFHFQIVYSNVLVVAAKLEHIAVCLGLPVKNGPAPAGAAGCGIKPSLVHAHVNGTAAATAPGPVHAQVGANPSLAAAQNKSYSGLRSS